MSRHIEEEIDGAVTKADRNKEEKMMISKVLIKRERKNEKIACSNLFHGVHKYYVQTIVTTTTTTTDNNDNNNNDNNTSQ